MGKFWVISLKTIALPGSRYILYVQAEALPFAPAFAKASDGQAFAHFHICTLVLPLRHEKNAY